MKLSTQGYLRLSVAVALVTIALKTGAWWLTDSVSLLSDALEGGVNVASALFGLAMVAVAALPPDDEHPYGHQKAEYFASGFAGGLVFAAAVLIAVAAAQRLQDPQSLAALGVGMALSLASAVLNGALAWAMLRHGRSVRSVALQADARHLRADVWTTLGVLVGLVAVHLSGLPWLDPLVALLVAAHIAREGWRLMREAVDGLMDHALDAGTRQAIDTVLAGFTAQAVSIDDVVTRRAGSRAYVDAHLHVPGHWSLADANTLRAEVEAELLAAVPGVMPVLVLLPAGSEPAALVRPIPSATAAAVSTTTDGAPSAAPRRVFNGFGRARKP